MVPRDADGLPPTRRGQIASERARYLARQAARPTDDRVLEEGLGELPPGYGLTYVRGWVRDPRHVVAVWDVNDPQAVRQADSIGWDRTCLRALDGRNRALVQVLVGHRAGTHHLAVPPGRTIRLAIGLERPDGLFLTLARSAPLRLPPGRPGVPGPIEHVLLPPLLDRRHCLRGEQPPRPGHRTAVRLSAGWRLLRRLEVAVESLPADAIPEDLAEIVRTTRDALPPMSPGYGEHADDVPAIEQDPVSSPFGWAPPALHGASPRHWLDRWHSSSGGGPFSPGVGGRPR